MGYLNDRIIPAIGMVLALRAVWTRVRAARLGRPGWGDIHMQVALLALVYVVAYALLVVGAVTNRADWSRYLTIPSLLAWEVTWTRPALRQVREGRAREALVEMKKGVGDAGG